MNRAVPILCVTESWDWQAAMRSVAARFNGTPGVFLHFGDSLTLAAPCQRWARDGLEHTPVERALRLADGTVPILATLTPCRDHQARVQKTNVALVQLAARLHPPLRDLSHEMDARNPNVLAYLEQDGYHLNADCSRGPPRSKTCTGAVICCGAIRPFTKGCKSRRAIWIPCRAS